MLLSIIHPCCGHLSLPPHCVIIIHPSPPLSCGCCHELLSSPKVAEGEGVMWQWLAGVTMATGWVVAINGEAHGMQSPHNVCPCLAYTHRPVIDG